MNVVSSVKSKYTIDEQRIFIAGQDAGYGHTTHLLHLGSAADSLTSLAPPAVSWRTVWHAIIPKLLQVSSVCAPVQVSKRS
jgi:poly(3-hydroxybutyrate) depolymerase